TDRRTDLYSVGVMLYELCVGHKLFVAGDALGVLAMHLHEAPVPPLLAAPDRGISVALSDVIMRALAKPREERFQSAEEFLSALDATPEGQGALGQASATRLRSLSRSNAVAVAALVVALLGIVMVVVKWFR